MRYIYYKNLTILMILFQLLDYYLKWVWLHTIVEVYQCIIMLEVI